MIEQDGWCLVKTKEDHRQFKHSIKFEELQFSGNLERDMPAGTLNSVLKQADLKGQ